MELTSLIEVISACHLSHYVTGPFEERGGIMLVAPPASFKSAIVQALDPYPNALALSDLTVKQAVNLREDIAANRIITLGFPAYEKLYQRHAAVSANVEGFILGITGEGYRKANWEDQRMQLRPARCAVIGAMTQAFYAQHFGAWIEGGFSRRFIWAQYQLEDPEIIARAISDWERIDLSNHGMSSRLPIGKSIKYDVTETEDKLLYHMLRFQPARDISYSLLKKILCALKWKHAREDENRPMRILKDFAESMSKDGALLTVTDGNKKPKKNLGMTKPVKKPVPVVPDKPKAKAKGAHA